MPIDGLSFGWQELVSKGVPKALSTSTPWCYYWVLHAMDMLDGLSCLQEELKESIVERIHR